jgi:ankyrin repeat protein
VVRLLIDDNRVDLNLRDIKDRTPLDLAAAKRNIEVIELLKAAGRVDASMLRNKGKRGKGSRNH